MHIEIQNCFSFWGTTPYRGFAPGPHWGTSVPQTPYTGHPPTFCTRFTPLWLQLQFDFDSTAVRLLINGR